MNKSKIEWTSFTWNVVTGCLHECDYCYARRIAERFKPHEMELMNIRDCRPVIPISVKNLSCYECDDPVYLTNFKGEKLRMCPYPEGFKPTFHRYRLDEPKKKTKGVKIFVSSMGDLFGDWVPSTWICDVLNVTEECPQHKFLFLTKNPKRYSDFIFNSNCWCGTTVTSEKDISKAWELLKGTTIHENNFLSIEPLLGRVDLDKNELLLEGYKNIATIGNYIDWVIVGAQTGPGAVPPKPEWIQLIIDQCKAAGVPVFLKDNLKRPVKIQEYPERLK
jgi:protein gp37